MASTFQKIKQLYEGKPIDVCDAQQVTYEDLLIYAYVTELLKIDSELNDSQLEYGYKCLQQGATIICKEGGIDIYSANRVIAHLSDTFRSSVESITITRQAFNITEKQKPRTSGGYISGGSSGNNNNNNNNNNNS